MIIVLMWKYLVSKRQAEHSAFHLLRPTSFQAGAAHISEH